MLNCTLSNFVLPLAFHGKAITPLGPGGKQVWVKGKERNRTVLVPGETVGCHSTGSGVKMSEVILLCGLGKPTSLKLMIMV